MACISVRHACRRLGLGGVKVITVIKWLDSHYESGWVNVQDSPIDGITCTSVGWVVSESDSEVVIAAHLSSGSSEVCSPMHIPVCSIVERYTLEEE